MWDPVTGAMPAWLCKGLFIFPVEVVLRGEMFLQTRVLVNFCHETGNGVSLVVVKWEVELKGESV